MVNMADSPHSAPARHAQGAPLPPAPSSAPRACVLTGFGINCEHETAHALSLAGATCELVHFNDLLADGGQSLEEFQILAVPGGFSFGDDIQSGRVLANKFRFSLRTPLRRFVDEGKPVLGVCNGFQTLVQLGVLPGWDDWSRNHLTLMANASGRFEDRWVRLRTERSACPYAQGMEWMWMPSRHGEGQLALSGPKVLERLDAQGQVVFRYASPTDGHKAMSYPDNPNGSCDAIAGLCNEAGNVLGLMPHPECHVRYAQTPTWTMQPPHAVGRSEGFVDDVMRGLGLSKPASVKDEGNCLPLFERMVAAGRKK